MAKKVIIFDDYIKGLWRSILGDMDQVGNYQNSLYILR